MPLSRDDSFPRTPAGQELRISRGVIDTLHIKNAAIGSAQIQNAAIGNAQLGTAVIGTANIGTLSFNQISGGTATLGGTTNGNGVLIVKDSGGTTRVTLDNAGVTITNGNISVTNTNGSSILDSSGIVSTSNFQFSQVFNGAATQVVGGTTYVDVTGGALSPFVLTRTTNVWTYMMGYMRGENITVPSINEGRLRMVDAFDNSEITNVVDTGGYFTEVNGGTPTYYAFALMAYQGAFNSLDAGTHTLKLQIDSAVSNGTISLAAFQIGYIIYGF